MEVIVVMLKIALVDDSVDDLLSAKNYLIDYISNKHSEIAKEIHIDTFSCAEDLLKTFKPNKYMLIVLDIFMINLNGFKASQIIRMRDKNCKIIFLTSSDEFILDGYSVFASGYFIKPIESNQQKFAETFEYIFPNLIENIQNLNIKIKGEELSIPYKNIYFVDINHNHYLRINLRDQEFITNFSYSNCQSQLLKDKRFLECHYRIIVNMDYIESMKDEDFILENSAKIPISQRRRRESKLTFMRYLANKG